MTARLRIIVALGLVAVVAAGGFAVYAHRPVARVRTDPTWGLFTDAQWRALGATRVVTAMPPLAVVAKGRCLLVLRGTTRLARLCGPSTLLVAYAIRERGMTDVVGVAQRRVASVVETFGGTSTNAFLFSAPHALAFGNSVRGRTVELSARDSSGREVARLYCASAFGAVCGSSAHRRS